MTDAAVRWFPSAQEWIAYSTSNGAILGRSDYQHIIVTTLRREGLDVRVVRP